MLKRMNLIPMLALSAVLAGCAAPPPAHYYTLMPPPGTSASGASASGAGAGGATTAATGGEYAISVQPVTIPAQVDRPQIVVGMDGSAQVVPLNQSLWVSPLDGQVRRALADDLTARLGVLDIAANAAPRSLPVWEVFLTVERFDLVFGKKTVLDVTWRLEPIHRPGWRSNICRVEIVTAVGPGVPALVAGQRAAIRTLSSLIAARITGKPASSRGASTVVDKGCVSPGL